VRGSTTEQVLVLIDGVPSNDTQTGHFHLDQTIPLDDVERIEVMRGAGSSLYGTNAVGGIVNIVTRRNAQRTLLRAEGGTFRTAELSGVTGVMLRGIAPLTFGVEHDLSDGHRSGTDYRTTIVHGSLGIPASGGMIRLNAGDAHRDFGASQFYAPFPTSYEKTRVIDAGAVYDRAYGEWSIEPRATIRKHYDDFVLKREDPAFYHNVHATTDAGASMLVRGVIGDIRTTLGGELYHSWITSTNLHRHSEVRNAEYGEAVAQRGIFTATGGLRADHHSRFGDFISPTVGAAARVTDRVLVRASAARGFRAPTWTDRYYSDPANIGDSTLKVERAWTYEAGTAVNPANHWRADVSGYVRRVTNAIDWVRPAGSPASVPFQIVNIQRASFRGVEAMLQRTEFHGTDWTVRATALSFDADSAAGLSSKYALRPLTETASLEVGVPLPFGVRLGAIATHQRRPGDAAYDLLDAQLGYNWRDLQAFL
jgi:iron complex outermembrane receptor protein